MVSGNSCRQVPGFRVFLARIETTRRMTSHISRVSAAIVLAAIVAIPPSAFAGITSTGRGNDDTRSHFTTTIAAAAKGAPTVAGAERPDMVRRFLTPQVQPVEGWFSDGYKWRDDPFTGERRFHFGIDIVAPVGTVVRAPADGQVRHASESGGYGNLVEIDHGLRFTTRLAHLDRVLVREGDAVRIGEPVGLVGVSGRTIGPHLHYEVIKDGRRVNPWRYLPRHGSGAAGTGG